MTSRSAIPRRDGPHPAMIYAENRGSGIRSMPRSGEARVTWMMLLVGLVVGMVSGVVGIGGGVLFVPALIWLLGMSQHKAQGTSLGALLAPVGLFAFMEYYRKGNADLRVALLLAAGFLVGGYFGAAGAQHIPEVWLRRIFAVTLVAIGGRMWFTR
ncbi:MAG: sulfite exporter TauE/SafE family protein [Terracidiphilus sp.]